MKTYTHRVVQLLSALAAAGGGGTIVANDPASIAGWVTLITAALIGAVTLYRQISDAATPTLPAKTP